MTPLDLSIAKAQIRRGLRG